MGATRPICTLRRRPNGSDAALKSRIRKARTAGGLIEVHVHALQLQVVLAAVGPSGVDAVLVAHHLPELGANLVAALAAL